MSRLGDLDITDNALTIHLDVTRDWGCEASAEDRLHYETAVEEAISKAFPHADVAVRSLAIFKDRAFVTMGDATDKLLLDPDTWKAEDEIGQTVLEIARAVWEAGEFWNMKEE